MPSLQTFAVVQHFGFAASVDDPSDLPLIVRLSSERFRVDQNLFSASNASPNRPLTMKSHHIFVRIFGARTHDIYWWRLLASRLA